MALCLYYFTLILIKARASCLYLDREEEEGAMVLARPRI
jgi:hypothetical protein